MSLFSLSSHLIFGRPLGRVPVIVVLSVLSVMCVSSRRFTCPYHDSRFCVRTELIGVTFAFPLMVSFLILSFLVFPGSSCLRSANPLFFVFVSPLSIYMYISQMQFSDYVTSVRMSILCILCNMCVTFNVASPKTTQINITRT